MLQIAPAVPAALRAIWHVIEATADPDRKPTGGTAGLALVGARGCRVDHCPSAALFSLFSSGIGR